MKRYFRVSQNKDGTYRVANKWGSVFDWGKNVEKFQIRDNSPHFINVLKQNKFWTVYDEKGIPVNGTINMIDITNIDRLLALWEKDKIKQEAENKEQIKKIAVIMSSLAVLAGFAGFGIHSQIKEEKTTRATYLGNRMIDGHRYVLFDTDNNRDTAEYIGYPQDWGAAVNLLKHETHTVAEWRKLGFSMYKERCE